jgi:hypothetical protein
LPFHFHNSHLEGIATASDHHRHRNDRGRTGDGCDLEIASVNLVRGGGITNAMDILVRPVSPFRLAPPPIIDEDLKDSPTLSQVIDRFRGGRNGCLLVRRGILDSTPPWFAWPRDSDFALC